MYAPTTISTFVQTVVWESEEGRHYQKNLKLSCWSKFFIQIRLSKDILLDIEIDFKKLNIAF